MDLKKFREIEINSNIITNIVTRKYTIIIDAFRTKNIINTGKKFVKISNCKSILQRYKISIFGGVYGVDGLA
jgi:hypothetical protein